MFINTLEFTQVRFQYTAKFKSNTENLHHSQTSKYPKDNDKKLCNVFRVLQKGEKMQTFPIINLY